jgi:hypothetical protein
MFYVLYYNYEYLKDSKFHDKYYKIQNEHFHILCFKFHIHIHFQLSLLFDHFSCSKHE